MVALYRFPFFSANIFGNSRMPIPSASYFAHVQNILTLFNIF
jgi:hypothetical protein